MGENNNNEIGTNSNECSSNSGLMVSPAPQVSSGAMIKSEPSQIQPLPSIDIQQQVQQNLPNSYHLPASTSSTTSSMSIQTMQTSPGMSQFLPEGHQIISSLRQNSPQQQVSVMPHYNSSFASNVSTVSSHGSNSPIHGVNNNNNNNSSVYTTADYLAQLLKDKKQLAAFPAVFHHVDRLIDDEINKVRGNLFQVNGSERRTMVLPEPEGAVTTRSEKVYVPIKDHPEYNFVGRILGPRGMTAKQLEQETGCKIMVRGRGSMRDRKKEESNRGKPNWEHLNDELHVLITCEDTPNRAEVKLERAKEEIRKLLVPVTDGDDDLKKRQLMELAILNGTYRDPSAKLDKENELLKMTGLPGMIRHPSITSLGSPLILGPPGGMIRGLLPGGVPSLMTSHDGQLLYHNPYDFSQYQMGHLIAAEYGSTGGQGIESLAPEDKRKKRRLN